MGIYWCAIDFERKLIIHPPNGFSCKTPGLFHPNNPFPGMVIMKNYQSCNFEIINDGEPWFYDDSYKDITKEVYEEYLNKFKEEKNE